MFLPLIIVGIAMAFSGVYTFVTKNVFGKSELGKIIIEVLKLSEKAVKIISIIYAIVITLIGLYFMINGLISPDPFYAFRFVMQ